LVYPIKIIAAAAAAAAAAPAINQSISDVLLTMLYMARVVHSAHHMYAYHQKVYIYTIFIIYIYYLQYIILPNLVIILKLLELHIFTSSHLIFHPSLLVLLSSSYALNVILSRRIILYRKFLLSMALVMFFVNKLRDSRYYLKLVVCCMYLLA
jgi:hypothetical protein